MLATPRAPRPAGCAASLNAEPNARRVRWLRVNEALAWGVPGMVLAMLAAGTYELIRTKRGRSSGTPVTATYVNEFTAVFYGTKRMELEHRDSMSMMRDEDAESGPPATGVDLEAGVIRLRPNGHHGGSAT